MFNNYSPSVYEANGPQLITRVFNSLAGDRFFVFTLSMQRRASDTALQGQNASKKQNILLTILGLVKNQPFCRKRAKSGQLKMPISQPKSDQIKKNKKTKLL